MDLLVILGSTANADIKVTDLLLVQDNRMGLVGVCVA